VPDSATQIAEDVRKRRISPDAAVVASLRRIDAMEGRLQAWVEVNRDAKGGAGGPLAGVPVGVKDIFDVAGLPTKYGAAAFAHRMPEADSAAVARLRGAGAAILGKTHTTQFAYMDPAPTRNPWDLEHTPGGSSSGSAAAVAAGMVPMALGSQTVGSVLRPAAYCGIVGFKPTYGRISNVGVGHLAPSFDHVGVLCRSVADVALALSVLAGYDPDDPYAVDAPVDDYAGAIERGVKSARIGLIRSYYENECGFEAKGNLEGIVSTLGKHGLEVVEVDLGFTATEVARDAQPVLASEAATVHAAAFAHHAADYAPHIRERIEVGLKTGVVEYIQAKGRAAELRQNLSRFLEGADIFATTSAGLVPAGSRRPLDALLLPTTPSAAPDLSTTGNSIFNGLASFSGLPAIALPSGLAENGLPLSVQLIGAPSAEARLLAVAALFEKLIPPIGEPPL
jgi:Asp-tRNA(Asn)/Glu-tRNA(Gln) amidotransferase A subunit family amidase